MNIRRRIWRAQESYDLLTLLDTLLRYYFGAPGREVDPNCAGEACSRGCTHGTLCKRVVSEPAYNVIPQPVERHSCREYCTVF